LKIRVKTPIIANSIPITRSCVVLFVNEDVVLSSRQRWGLAQWHPCYVSRALNLTWKLLLKLKRFLHKNSFYFCEFLRNGHSVTAAE
jgi:hypothetical protein